MAHLLDWQLDLFDLTLDHRDAIRKAIHLKGMGGLVGRQVRTRILPYHALWIVCFLDVFLKPMHLNMTL